ncbi:MAG: hypothetical protein LW832_09965, partial [Parachlamydia sp.]|nr:hypothetical protein [Parachlamydia sp.]
IFHRHLLRPSSLLDLTNLSKFAAISAMHWDIKSRRQKFKNLPACGIRNKIIGRSRGIHCQSYCPAFINNSPYARGAGE